MTFFSLLFLWQQIRTLKNCSPCWHDFGRYTIPGLMVSCLSQLVSFLGVLGAHYQHKDKEKYWNWFRKGAVVCYWSATMINFTPGLIYPLCITAATGITYIHWIDTVSWESSIEAAVPVFGILITAALWRWILVKAIDKFVVAAMGYAVILGWTAAAYVFMGKIIGSPSGVCWLKNKFEEVDVAWMTVFPIAQSILAGVSGVFGA